MYISPFKLTINQLYFNHLNLIKRYTWGSSLSGEVNSTLVALYDGFFNWNMTYRTDADIKVPFGSIKQIKSSLTSPITFNPIPNLPQLTYTNGGNQSVVTWMASHCGTHGRREDYIRELKRYIPVDSYTDTAVNFVNVTETTKIHRKSVTNCSNPSTNSSYLLRIQFVRITSLKSSSGSRHGI